MKSFERFQKWSAAKQSAEVKILSSSFSCVATIKSNISRSLEREISSSAELLTVVVQEMTLRVQLTQMNQRQLFLDLSCSWLLHQLLTAPNVLLQLMNRWCCIFHHPASFFFIFPIFCVTHWEWWQNWSFLCWATSLGSVCISVWLSFTIFVHTAGLQLFQNTQNELPIVLLKLRLNLVLEDLSRCFEIGTGSVSCVVQRWLNVMYVWLKFLIVWPTRDVIRKNVPNSIKQHYSACVCAIDCSEIFINIPTNFKARAQTYSNYK